MARRRRSSQAAGRDPGRVSRFHAGESQSFEDSTDFPDSWSVPRVVAASRVPEFDLLPDVSGPPEAPVGFFSRKRVVDESGSLVRKAQDRLLAFPRGVGNPPAPRRYSALSLLQVAVPERSKVCVSRVERKQVLFAKGKAGRRGSAPGPYVRKVSSNWRC